MKASWLNPPAQCGGPEDLSPVVQVKAREDKGYEAMDQGLPVLPRARPPGIAELGEAGCAGAAIEGLHVLAVPCQEATEDEKRRG